MKLLALALVTTSSLAIADCPKVVVEAAAKAFPGSTLSACKAEHEKGHDFFEAKLVKRGGGNVELDLAADGKVLQIEEVIPVEQLPAAVAKAFAAKYPKAKPARVEKQTAEARVTYEIAFAVDKGKKEATFDERGTFVEEE